MGVRGVVLKTTANDRSDRLGGVRVHRVVVADIGQIGEGLLLDQVDVADGFLAWYPGDDCLPALIGGIELLVVGAQAWSLDQLLG